MLVSPVSDSVLTAHTLWSRDGSESADEALLALSASPIRLDYALVEAEVATRRGALSVIVQKNRGRASAVLVDVLAWDSYVVAALTLHSTTVGLLHAGMASPARRVDELDQEVTEIYASSLADSFERAALRQTLRRHRQELQHAIRWMGGRLSSVSTLPPPRSAELDAGLDSLTRREREVLHLLTTGSTNGDIAEALVISESTAQYHVKNILRKLQATSRAEAVAHHARRGSGSIEA